MNWVSISRLARISVVLTLLLAFSDLAMAQNVGHRWGGYVFDPFVRQTATGTFEAWTGEDGGRIRYRHPTTGTWSFQVTPVDVKDTIRRVHFLPLGPNQQHGWAVGNGGYVLKTINGGATWSVLTRIPRIPSSSGWDDLYDVHFLNLTDGWLMGKERQVLATTNGGASWFPVSMLNAGGAIWTPTHTDEGYAVDIIERNPGAPNPGRVGLAISEPGRIFRSVDPTLLIWQEVLDLRDVVNHPGSYPCIPLSGCELASVEPFEPWDVEISRHPTQNLALVAGGRGVGCGFVLSSTNDGLTWCKEFHECTCTGTGCNTTCATNPAYNPPSGLYRHKVFTTLYGVAIQSNNNAAIATGYNGQQVLRDPATGVWLDRSVFSLVVPTLPGAVKFPLYGASFAGPNASGQTLAVVTGAGGLLRESTDGGNVYAAGLRQTATVPEPIVGEPNRIKDAFFRDELVGWHVGQLGRIARSTDGGFNWDEQAPFASALEPTLHAIVFAPGGVFGVAVGDKFTPPGSSTTQPKIRYTTNGGVQSWDENPPISGDPLLIDGRRLNEVDYSGSTPTGRNFWAVGQGGMVLKSQDDGQSWNLIWPVVEADSEPFAHFELFTANGVSFMNTTTGLIVGERPIPSPGGPNLGAAYQVREVAGQHTWTSIALDPAIVVRRLTDVDVVGSVAWAVGEKVVNGALEGVVLTSTFTGGSFGTFTEVAPPASGFVSCDIGDDLSAWVLSEVEVAPGGTVWVAGMCGRTWKRVAAAWVEIKSQTDAHVVGMSFVSTAGGDVGYVGGLRGGQQCIVKVQ